MSQWSSCSIIVFSILTNTAAFIPSWKNVPLEKSVLFFFFFFCLFGAVQLCSLTWWNGRLLWPKTRKRGRCGARETTRLIESSRAGQRKQTTALLPVGGERFILSWPVHSTWHEKLKLVQWTFAAWHFWLCLKRVMSLQKPELFWTTSGTSWLFLQLHS